MKSQKTTIGKPSQRLWYEIDASKRSLGRVASMIATLLRGKHKKTYTPQADLGDFVVAINVDRLKFTGRKVEQKKYYRHSGYLGGLKTSSLKVALQKYPAQVLKRAVYSMIDDIKFRKKLLSRLKLVQGKDHSYKIDKVL